MLYASGWAVTVGAGWTAWVATQPIFSENSAVSLGVGGGVLITTAGVVHWLSSRFTRLESRVDELNRSMTRLERRLEKAESGRARQDADPPGQP